MHTKFLVFITCISFFMLGCEQYPEPAIDTGERINLQAIYSINQHDVDKIAGNLKVNYRIARSLPSDKCSRNPLETSCFAVKLSLTAKHEISAKDWTIVFSHLSPINSLVSKDFIIKHLNGDLHEVILKDTYAGFRRGETKTLTFNARLSSLSEVMPNFIITAARLDARVIESTKPIHDISTGLEILPHVTYPISNKSTFSNSNSNSLTSTALYQRNKAQLADETALMHSIIPTPKSINIDPNFGFAHLSQGIHFSLGNVLSSDVDAAIARLVSLGIKDNRKGLPLHLSIVEDINKTPSSYQLAITEHEITIVAVDASGVFNGLQSLASLITMDDPRLAIMTIEDEPEYAFRGIMLDVARNFHSKAFVLKLLDQMAAYKLNKLQLHLGDDEGWRIEIPSLPELTDIGAKRCLDFGEDICLLPMLGAGNDERSNVNGYYTVNDYQEILRAAKARHIQVIPSFSMPSHSRAAIKSMTARYNSYLFKGKEDLAEQFLLEAPLSKVNESEDETSRTTEVKRIASTSSYYDDSTLNICLESSYLFVSKVMSQLHRIHDSANHQLQDANINTSLEQGNIATSPQCAAFMSAHNIAQAKQLDEYFSQRLQSILAKLNINMIDLNTTGVLSVDLTHDFTSNKLSSRDTIVNDLGLFWRLVNEKAQTLANAKKSSKPTDKLQLQGLQGQLWSEKLRTNNMVEYMMFPRLLVVAEQAWHRANRDVQNNTTKNKQWNNFANTLGEKELRKLEHAGLDYRLPNVGAEIRSGKLYANIALPTLSIEYQVDNGPWRAYQKPINVSGSINVRSRTHNGVRMGEITSVK